MTEQTPFEALNEFQRAKQAADQFLTLVILEVSRLTEHKVHGLKFGSTLQANFPGVRVFASRHDKKVRVEYDQHRLASRYRPAIFKSHDVAKVAARVVERIEKAAKVTAEAARVRAQIDAELAAEAAFLAPLEAEIKATAAARPGLYAKAAVPTYSGGTSGEDAINLQLTLTRDEAIALLRQVRGWSA